MGRGAGGGISLLCNLDADDTDVFSCCRSASMWKQILKAPIFHDVLEGENLPVQTPPSIVLKSRFKVKSHLTACSSNSVVSKFIVGRQNPASHYFFVNKVLLGHGHIHFRKCYLWSQVVVTETVSLAHNVNSSDWLRSFWWCCISHLFIPPSPGWRLWMECTLSKCR